MCVYDKHLFCTIIHFKFKNNGFYDTSKNIISIHFAGSANLYESLIWLIHLKLTTKHTRFTVTNILSSANTPFMSANNILFGFCSHIYRLFPFIALCLPLVDKNYGVSQHSVSLIKKLKIRQTLNSSNRHVNNIKQGIRGIRNVNSGTPFFLHRNRIKQHLKCKKCNYLAGWQIINSRFPDGSFLLEITKAKGNNA